MADRVVVDQLLVPFVLGEVMIVVDPPFSASTRCVV
jgi:hypothetical protein